MFSLDEKLLAANTDESQRVQALIVGRLLVIFLLLVTAWIWYSREFELSVKGIPEGLILPLIISVGLTVIYFLALRVGSHPEWQARVQLIVDAVVITWLVWRTGDLSSPYITLYIVLIGVSSLFLRPRSTLVMAGFCIASFNSMALLVSLGIIDSSQEARTPGNIIQIVSFHTVAFLVVGLLASKLSERRFSGDQLKETAKTLANLRVLHERIIESIRSGLITTDLEGNIYTFNRAAAEITGQDPDDMKGQTIFSLFGDISQPIEISLNGSVDQLPRFEADLVTPDGFAVRIGYAIAPLYIESGETSGMIITFQDLTEIRSMEESIRRKDRLAAVGRVGAGLAHEIRNPLGAMRGAIQVLESTTPPGSVQADLMNIILRESDRLNSIITNFLSYAKPKVGDYDEIDLNEAITDTITLMRHSPDMQKSHELVAELPQTPTFVFADSTQIKQVFWNLSRNALQAMPDGGKLTIRVEPLPSNRVRIVFEDTGRGMSQSQVEQLFEPFASSTSGGTGLGLSIVYQIIRDHSGNINVRSFEGEGTVITVELPRDNRAKAPSTEGKRTPDATAKSVTQLVSVENKRTEFPS